MNSTQSDFLDQLFSEIEESIRRYRHVSAASGISSLSLLKAHIEAERKALVEALKRLEKASTEFEWYKGDKVNEKDARFEFNQACEQARAALAKAGIQC